MISVRLCGGLGNTEKEHYVYVWYRRDGTPYYVGKASRKGRAYGQGRHSVRAPARDCIEVIPMPDEETALLVEMNLIALYGRKDIGTGVLRNYTDGGEGSSGLKQSPETIEKRVSKLRGKRCPDHVREKIAEAQRGTKSHSHKAAGASHWNRGLVRSPETRAKLREARARQDMSSRVQSRCKRGHLISVVGRTKKRHCKGCHNLLNLAAYYDKRATARRIR